MLYSIMFLAAEAEEKTSLGTALLNTIMSIIIVFAMLIIISMVISLFRYIPVLQERFQKKSQVPVTQATPVPASEPELVEEEELSDDLELVAVITAAIHAYEESMGNEVPADGLVVRSIKRINKSRWQNS